MNLLALALAACGAMPNPKPPAAPAAWTPEPQPASAPSTPVQAEKPAAQPAPVPANGAPAATPGQDARAGSTAPAPVSGSAAVATVAGETVDVRELLAQWFHRNNVEVLEQIDHLVVNRLVLAESRRLGVEVAPERAEKAYQDAVASIEAEIGKKRPGMTLDQYVDRRLGLDPLRYRERLRDDALRAVLAARVIRSWVLSNEHARIRVCVVDSEVKVREVQAAIAAGTPFEEIARTHSTDSSAKNGGRVPPVVRSDHTMSKIAFETAVGSVGGPRFEQGAWIFALVEARPEPLPEAWPTLGPEVEKSLAERGIEDLEMQQWQAAMLRRYPVDVSPFLRLVGEPSR